MMKKLMKAFLLAGALSVAAGGWESAKAQANADELGWWLGAQAYTFNRFTLAEALDKMDSCGIQYVECYSGQQIGDGIEGTTDFKMPASRREQLKALFKKKHKTLVAYGVVSPQNEAEWQQMFDF